MANYVFNSSLSGETYNAKCLNVSDDSEWTPSAAEYPQDGTIDLSGGTSGRYLDTQWIAPQDTEWTMSGIYNVVMGVSYDMYSIHYKGNQTCDIYLGSSTEDLTLSESDKDYTPPTGNWIIEEEPPAIIIPPVGATLKSYISLVGFDTTTYPTPNGEQGNAINGGDTTTVYNIIDGDGVDNGWTYQTIIAMGGGVSNSLITSGNPGFHFDAMMYNNSNINTSPQSEFMVDAGTYTLTFTGGIAAGGDRILDVTIDGVNQNMVVANNTLDGLTFTGVVSDGVNPIVVDYASTGGDSGYLSSMTIERTS